MNVPLPPRRVDRPAGRTPLGTFLRRALRLATAADGSEALAVEGLAAAGRDRFPSRRSFLGASGAFLAALPESRKRPPRRRPLPAQQPRIAVVGAGMAGLRATDILRQAGFAATLYSAEGRVGGRVVSSRDFMAPGLTTELGGEFIDSSHRDMLALAREFGLGLIDLDRETLPTAYIFGGARYSDAQLVEALRPLAKRIVADLATTSDDPSASAHTPGDVRLDRMSMEEYLEAAGATGVVMGLIRSAYLGEDGRELGDQSSLNLVTSIGTNPRGGLRLFGTSDERYKVRGGNQQIVDRLASRVSDRIVLDRQLVSLRARGQGFALTFATGGGPALEVAADVVILAIPFSTLRAVDLRVDLPPLKWRAIREQAYGMNTKLFAGVRSRPWRALGYSGDGFTDEGFQECWDNGAGQMGPAGGLTLMLGGAAAVAAGLGTTADQVERLLPGVDHVFPGVSAAVNGHLGRAAWTSRPFSLGSYSTYGPGQYTAIGGAQFFPVGNLHFAGEHCNHPDLGYMDGAARTGRIAAQNVIARLRR